MTNSKKFNSHEDYWEDFHNEKLPPPDAKETPRMKYDSNISYWLDYYEEQIEFACTKVNMQLRSAQERKREQEFEFKLYAGIMLVMIVLLPLVFALPMTKILPFMILGGLLAIVEIVAFVLVMPVCVYKIIQGYVSKIINDNENSLGDRIVQKYQLPRLTGEIQACQIHVGRYKEQLANIKAWREMLEEDKLDVEESEIRNRLEKVNLEPDIEVASPNNGKLKRMIRRITVMVAVIIFGLLFGLIVKGYIDYYNFFLDFWRKV